MTSPSDVTVTRRTSNCTIRVCSAGNSWPQTSSNVCSAEITSASAKAWPSRAKWAMTCAVIEGARITRRNSVTTGGVLTLFIAAPPNGSSVYLANNVVFIQISTDVSSALKIFETINERGVGLNPMDLLKNLLFAQVKQTQFSQLKDEWKKITKPLEKGKEKPLRFLRYFLMANYVIKNERGDAVVREDEIYDWFIAKDNAALCDY